MLNNHTSNYHLSQWKETDKVLMEDFNADNEKIDAALSELKAQADNHQLATTSRIAIGTYTGNGANTQDIDLGFAPRAVLVMDYFGNSTLMNSSFRISYYGGLALRDYPVRSASDFNAIALQVTETGFRATLATNIYFYLNENKRVYHYIAIE